MKLNQVIWIELIGLVYKPSGIMELKSMRPKAYKKARWILCGKAVARVSTTRLGVL